MQSKPLNKPSALPTPEFRPDKVEPNKQVQPLDLKTLGQISGGRKSPFTQW